MWRAAALPLLLLLLGGCKSPRAPFDPGFTVSVIVLAKPVPTKGIRIEPVCALGPTVARPPQMPLGGEGPSAVEVATFTVPKGRHLLSFWEPRLKKEARAEIDVKAERWVVVTMEPRTKRAQLKVYDQPPDAQIGAWQPLVAVPD